MLNKYGERTQPCWTPFLTLNHYDSVPATLTLSSELFPVQFGQQVSQVHRISHVHHGHPELVMGDRVERLLEVHKTRIEWLLVLACLVRQYSEIRDLISCPPSLSESRLFRVFICNLRFGLHSDPFQYDPKKDLTCTPRETRAIVL